MRLRTILFAAVAFVGSVCGMRTDACTRVVYAGQDSLFIVGRTLDWKTPIPTNLYVYPRGMEKQSSSQPNAIKWVSKYGSVYAVGYDAGVTEGMNECGLAVNGLFCNDAVYDGPENADKAPMALSMFVAWLLDNNATTAEVCDVLEKGDFHLVESTFDNGTKTRLHWAVTDATGETAVFEFYGGKVNIYRGRDLHVLANTPAFPDMQAINNYWQNIGGKNFLPGGVTSPDRFVRASFFDNSVEKTGDADLGAYITRSIMANVSVPFTYMIKGEPHLSSTQWRSLANLRDAYYYFDIITNPGLFYIDLRRLDLYPGAPVLKLDTSKSSDLVGCANHALKVSKPFTPMY